MPRSSERGPASRRGCAWIAGDDDGENAQIERALAERFATTIFANGTSVLAELETRAPDVLIVHPENAAAAIEVCSVVRRRHDAGVLPILVLTPPECGAEEVESLFEAGASDAMARPFRHRELVARAGSLVRVAQLARDRARLVTELEDAVARARGEHARAELANEMKDRFLATVSHELRTPLNAILGWTVLTRAETLPEDVDRVFAIIERNARAQSRLIEDVLDFSRAVTGNLRLDLGPTNVGEALDAAVEAVRPAATAKEIDLCVDIDERIGLISADRQRLQQIVWNILANAVKFTPKAGRVDLVAHRKDGEIVIQVRDTGPGIPAGFVPSLFEPFQQADGTQTRREGGLGLGLAIVNQLVQAHAGSILVESKENHGTTFTIRLPAQDVPVLRAQRDTPTSSASSKAEAGRIGPLPRLDELRVIIVDDDDDSRVLLAQLLARQGARVEQASSAFEALELFARAKPDVVVSDIGMPRVDGLTLVRKLRSFPTERGGAVPAIALSAHVRDEDAKQAYEAGFQAHVAKPVEPQLLLETIRRVAVEKTQKTG